MKNTPLLSLLTAGALVAPASAQSFDLILPTKVQIDNFATVVGFSGSLIVNTGVEEIDPAEWGAGYFYSESPGPLTGQICRPAPSFGTPVAPGTAVGIGNAEMLALLDGSETLASQAEDPMALSFGGSGVFTTSVTGYVQFGDQRATFSLEVQVQDDVPGFAAILGAQRVSSVFHPSPYGYVEAGCPLQGFELGLHPEGGPGFEPIQAVGLGANLPFIGHQGLTLRPGPTLPPAAGSPFVVVAGLDPSPSFAYLGCDLIDLQTVLATGTLTAGPGDGASAGEVPAVPVPLPDDPALVGTELAFQWAVVTPLAENGVFSASDVLRMTIEAP
ncbi:MAG: hypothetical protein AAF682_11860 [Planctomycetota bacterium]